MTQEEKDLLLKDLSARLLYRVKVIRYIERNNKVEQLIPEMDLSLRLFELSISNHEYILKPYLRPLSSMTEEEFDDMFKQLYSAQEEFFRNCSNNDTIRKIIANDIVRYDWLNEHHFDYRGLIEKGLALEAPEGTYK